MKEAPSHYTTESGYACYNAKMNIAIDARFYGLEHAGLGRYTSNLISELSHIDTQNTYTLLVWEKYKDLSFGPNFRTYIVNAPHHTFREQVLLAKAIKDGKYDLVHFPHFIVPILNLRTPFVATIHDLIKHKHSNKEATTLPLPIFYAKYLVYKFVMWWAVRRSQKIIVPTLSVKHDLVSYFKLDEKKVAVTYEGFDNTIASALDNSLHDKDVIEKYHIKHPYYIYVGNSYPYKNIQTLIHALDFLPDSFTLVLVGSRSIFWERTAKLVEDLDKKDRVVITGYVPDEELGILYKNAIAYTSASLEEGFGITPLEAMGVGCPAIISDIPVFREVCGDAAVYFDPHAPQGLASRILEVYNDQEYRSGLIEKGYMQGQRYSWRKMAEETEHVYQEIAR